MMNSGKISPDTSPRLQKNNWHSFHVVPLALAAPYPIFNVSFLCNIPWVSDGEICWIFGSYLLLKSQKGTGGGKRNLTQSPVRLTLP